MKKIGFLCAFLLFCQPARAEFVSVVAEIGSFLQSGIISNLSDPGFIIRKITLDLGPAVQNGATFDTNRGATLSGGTPSNFFADNRYFQTLTFPGLSIGQGQKFQYSGLDLDVILRFAPLSIGGSGGSIAQASLTVEFDKGLLLSMQFSDLPAEIPQVLTTSAQVPEPASWILWLSVLLIGYAIHNLNILLNRKSIP